MTRIQPVTKAVFSAILIIVSDNKERKYHPYYRFEVLFDNKDFVIIIGDNWDECSYA